jgi:tRNA (mo5U34)-methyltransferase
MIFTPQDAVRLAKRVKWFHTMKLPGVETQGFTDPEPLFTRLKNFLPDLAGKNVLDVGAWDGYFSFKAEELGAARVLATDHFCWSGPGWGTNEGFRIAHTLLRSKVESLDIDVQDISTETVGRWDVVLFLGVLYHRPDFYDAFQKVADVASDVLVVETVIDKEIDQTLPLVRFYPAKSFANNDAWDIFVPNPLLVRMMFQSAGFSNVELSEYDHGDPLHRRGIFVGRRG